jgi:hypothetical protein
MRGARGGQARRRKPVDQPANPEPDGATRGTRARNGGISCMSSRDLTFEAGPAGGFIAPFA